MQTHIHTSAPKKWPFVLRHICHCSINLKSELIRRAHTHSHASVFIHTIQIHANTLGDWIIYRYANNNNHNNNNNETLKKNPTWRQSHTSIQHQHRVNECECVWLVTSTIVFCYTRTHRHTIAITVWVTHRSRMYVIWPVLRLCACSTRMDDAQQWFVSSVRSVVRFVRSLIRFVHSECSLRRSLYRSIIWLLLFSLNVNVIMCWRLFVFSLGKFKYS